MSNSRKLSSNDNRLKRVINANDRFRELVLGEEVLTEEDEPEGPSPEEIFAEKMKEIEELKSKALQEIEDARKEANGIIAVAKSNATEIERNAKNDGFNLGFAEGNEKANAILTEEKASLDELKASLEQDYYDKLEHMETDLVDTMLKVFEGVFRIEFSGKKELLLRIIQNSMRGIKETRSYKIRVSEEEVSFIREHKSVITDMVGSDVTVEVVMDADLKPGECFIDADSGIYECSIDTQLDNLIRTLKELSYEC